LICRLALTLIAMKIRCPWARGEANVHYHDTEWGVPQHDDRVSFEFLVLEGAQAGLSWSTILLKRENYRRAFDGFDPAGMANYRGARLEKLMKDPGIVRNRLKITAAIQNAKSLLAVRKEYGTLDRYIRQFVDGQTLENAWQSRPRVPTHTAEADRMSRDLLHRGFKFVDQPSAMHSCRWSSWCVTITA
jgi:DNA-3-methyladenine glycosylase I